MPQPATRTRKRETHFRRYQIKPRDRFRFIVERFGFSAWRGFMRLLGYRRSTAFAGWLLARLGPKVRKQEDIDANLELIFPALDAPQRARLSRKIWHNLGRLFAEISDYRRLGRIQQERTAIQGFAEHIQPHLDAGRGVILVTGHFGNWELVPLLFAKRLPSLACLYAPPHNPAIERFISQGRKLEGAEVLARTDKDALHQVLTRLKKGGGILTLVDMRLPGEMLEFAGQPARTTLSHVRWAQKGRAALVPVRIIRQGASSDFTIQISPAREIGPDADLKAEAQAINDLFTLWLEDDPAQWFWLHRRWR